MQQPTLDPLDSTLSTDDTQQHKQFMQEGAAQSVALLKAVGNSHRMLVLCLLMEFGELTVTQMLDQIDLSQSALSQHLARMRDEQLVTYRRESQTLYYRISDPNVRQLIATLKAIFCPNN